MTQRYLSLQGKLFFSFTIVTLLAAVLPVLFLRGTIYEERLERATQEALAQARLMKIVLESTPGQKNIEKFFESNSTAPSRITLIDSVGKVILDSHFNNKAVENLDNHNDRPEIEKAREMGLGIAKRHSSSLDMEAIYAAILLNDGRILRVAMPLADIRQIYDAEFSAIVFSMGGVIVFCLLLSMFIARRVYNSVSDMIDVVESISLGHFHSRLHEVPGREFMPLAEAVNRMAENIERSVQTTKDQQMQLETILHSLDEGVLVLDTKGQVRSYNRALETLFPAIKEGEGQQLIESLPLPSLQWKVDELLMLWNAAGCKEKGKITSESLQFETADGRFLLAHISKAAQLNETLGLVIVFYDATEFMQLERVRRDFVSNVSHELRTPLTAIASSAEILVDAPELDDKYRKFAQVIYKHAAMLSTIINDLLALARLESLGEEIKMTILNPRASLEEALSVCCPDGSKASLKNIQFEVDMPDEIKIQANGPMLTQVFCNLLENACRYSPVNSKITISAKLQGMHWLFAVADNGTGIPKEAIPRIFERFYQVGKGRVAGNSGGPGQDSTPTSGLGLSICKHIIEKHGGRIWVKSPYENASTVVFFTLPIKLV